MIINFNNCITSPYLIISWLIKVFVFVLTRKNKLTKFLYLQTIIAQETYNLICTQRINVVSKLILIFYCLIYIAMDM